jgi:hypothetical protein
MTDNISSIISVIPPIVGTALTLEVIDRLLPSKKEARKRKQRSLKKVKKVV